MSSLLRLPTSPGRAAVLLLIPVLMIANAAAMLAAGLLIHRRNAALYFTALLILVVNILLTFTDQFGLIDFITLLVDLILVLILLSARKEFTTPKIAQS